MDLLNQYMTVIIAAAAVLALLVLLLVVWRSFSQRVRGRRGQRLGISEYHELDQTRRLVLIRRDNVEHLLLIGGAHDLVIEPSIGIPSHPTTAMSDADILEAPRPIAMRTAPRAPGYGERHASPPLRSSEREPLAPMPPPRGRDT